MILLVNLIFQQIGNAQSALDVFEPKANGIIQTVVVQPDGKILFDDVRQFTL